MGKHLGTKKAEKAHGSFNYCLLCVMWEIESMDNLTQWFSSGLFPPRGCLHCLETFLVVINEGKGATGI